MSDGIGTGWRARGGWDDVIFERNFGTEVSPPGVIVDPLPLVGMASLLIGHSSDIKSKIGSLLQSDLPAIGAATKGKSFDLVWMAPGQWLAVSREHDVVQRLQNLVGNIASVVDQTGARATVRLSGPCVRKALAKGCPIDLDPRAFPSGAAATTNIALIGASIWTLPNDEAIYVSIFRSTARSFWSWLKQSSAEFGLSVRI